MYKNNYLRILFVIEDIAVRDGKFDFDKALEINHKYADAYANRGIAKSALGFNKEAIMDFDKAIEVNPDFAFAYLGRGIAKSNLGQKEEAEKDFNEAVNKIVLWLKNI